MSFNRKASRIGRRISVFSLLVFFLLPPGVSTAGTNDDIRGNAFTDPDYVLPMDHDWIGRPISYVEGSGDHTLSVLINQQVSPVLMPMVKRFAEEQGISLEAKVGTCGVSAGALSRKEVDMGGYCCPPGKVDRLPGLRFHTLGISPLLVLVNAENPVRNVTREQAEKLFRGEIHNWSKLGGRDAPVVPLGMLHCKKRPGHWRLILDSAEMFALDFRVTGDIQDTISMVASNPNAVGFEIMMNILASDYAGKIRPLWIDGHDPMDLKRLARGEYPFYRTMNVTTWEGEGLANPEALRLLEFTMKQAESLPGEQGVAPASALREAGWKFNEDELTGEPKR